MPYSFQLCDGLDYGLHSRGIYFSLKHSILNLEYANISLFADSYEKL